MSSDARIATGLPRHPKTVKLIRRLQERGAWALVCLFLWVADNRSDGNLAGMTDEDIEIAAGWTGDPDVLVRTLADVGFLDGEAGMRMVHQWAEHNPWAASRGQRVESAKHAAVERWNAERMRRASGAHADRNAPNPTQPTPTKNIPSNGEDLSSRSTEDLKRIIKIATDRKETAPTGVLAELQRRTNA